MSGALSFGPFLDTILEGVKNDQDNPCADFCLDSSAHAENCGSTSRVNEDAISGLRSLGAALYRVPPNTANYYLRNNARAWVIRAAGVGYAQEFVDSRFVDLRTRTRWRRQSEPAGASTELPDNSDRGLPSQKPDEAERRILEELCTAIDYHVNKLDLARSLSKLPPTYDDAPCESAQVRSFLDLFEDNFVATSPGDILDAVHEYDIGAIPKEKVGAAISDRYTILEVDHAESHTNDTSYEVQKHCRCRRCNLIRDVLRKLGFLGKDLLFERRVFNMYAHTALREYNAVDMFVNNTTRMRHPLIHVWESVWLSRLLNPVIDNACARLAWVSAMGDAEMDINYHLQFLQRPGHRDRTLLLLGFCQTIDRHLDKLGSEWTLPVSFLRTIDTGDIRVIFRAYSQAIEMAPHEERIRKEYTLRYSSRTQARGSAAGSTGARVAEVADEDDDF
ncbi:hypothetical protein BD626DRAFT_536137 [Schizophyllum amplum]|uniref:Uncharacterized protein n=1 Tax=Schizophyllum amplum TaxID=97359 RepID=A0A550CJE4_9AGAR|nr:hypothetical protein BD626DRAFT_536137 [Auriculariopsis ampla]